MIVPLVCGLPVAAAKIMGAGIVLAALWRRSRRVRCSGALIAISAHHQKAGSTVHRAIYHVIRGASGRRMQNCRKCSVVFALRLASCRVLVIGHDHSPGVMVV